MGVVVHAATLVSLSRLYALDVHEDAGWETPDPWRAPWSPTPDAELEDERARLLELARNLAEQRERERAEAIAEVEELKRSLREAAHQVAERERRLAAAEAEREERRGRPDRRERRAERHELQRLRRGGEARA